MRKTLTLTSELAAGLMVIAAANLALIYVLLSARHHVGPPTTDLASNLPIVAIGGSTSSPLSPRSSLISPSWSWRS
jgi:hypothetical protein